MRAKIFLLSAIITALLVYCFGFLIMCKHKDPAAATSAYPRVVKSLCGKYAVKIRNRGWRDSQDSVYDFIGLNLNQSNGNVIYINIDGNWKNMTLENAKKELYKGDTMYSASIGYELIFEDSLSAISAINSYLSKKRIEKMLTDSINACHIYH